jgi:hypothetical protein
VSQIGQHVEASHVVTIRVPDRDDRLHDHVAANVGVTARHEAEQVYVIEIWPVHPTHLIIMAAEHGREFRPFGCGDEWR